MHLLVQAAAERDIDLLKPPAQGQYRYPVFNREPDQTQGIGVACRVVQIALVTALVGIMMWLDVAWRAGQDQEIGRASRRERVCQYVSVSVVAVSLKKKKVYEKQ